MLEILKVTNLSELFWLNSNLNLLSMFQHVITKMRKFKNDRKGFNLLIEIKIVFEIQLSLIF